MKPDHKWAALAVIGTAQLMVVLDATIVNIALPAAQHELGFTDQQRQWVITAYSLAFGSLLLLGGRLSDVFGRKNVFIVGLAGFALASALGGAAQTFEWLVAARALQGAFGALLAPAALGLMTTTFVEPAERGRAFGIFGAIAGSGGAAGLLLGGLLTEFATWRWCLFVNLVFAIFALGGAVVFIRRGSAHDAAVRVNMASVLTVTAGLGSLVFGFSNAGAAGWSDPVTITCIAAGAALLVVFVVLQARVKNPLLPLRIVLDRDRGASYLVIALLAVGMFGTFLFLTYYLELTLGLTPAQTGAAFLPFTLSIIVGSTFIGGRLLPAFGAKPLVFSGCLVAAAGMAYLANLGAHSNYWAEILPPQAIMGLGIGTTFAAAISTSTSGVDPEDAGVASATVNAMQQIGGSVGTALLSTISAGAIASFLAAHGANHNAAALAAVSSYKAVFLCSAVVYALAGVGGGLLLRRRHRLVAEPPIQTSAMRAHMTAAHCALILDQQRRPV